MKKIFLIICLLSSAFTFAQTNEIKPTISLNEASSDNGNRSKENEINAYPEILLTEKGQDFRQYFIDQFEFPTEAQDNSISGYINIEFIIEKTGEATNIKILRSLCESCDAEAIRVIKSTRFKPCQIDGISNRCNYSFPIKLVLEE